jgi:hypothetical protein
LLDPLATYQLKFEIKGRQTYERQFFLPLLIGKNRLCHAMPCHAMFNWCPVSGRSRAAACGREETLTVVDPMTASARIANLSKHTPTNQCPLK